MTGASTDTRTAAWLWAAISLATFLVFLPALGGEFLNWDDNDNFVENTGYRGFGWANLKWMFTTFGLGPYSPLMWLAAGFDYAIWGLKPFGWHLASVLLHGVNGVLVFLPNHEPNCPNTEPVTSRF